MLYTSAALAFISVIALNLFCFSASFLAAPLRLVVSIAFSPDTDSYLSGSLSCSVTVAIFSLSVGRAASDSAIVLPRI